MPKKRKNPAAVALGARRWYGTTQEERTAYAKWVASHNSGRPRKTDVPRCACGNMTLHTATIRGGKRGTSVGHKPGCTFYLTPKAEVA